jgi:hypothetical protein
MIELMIKFITAKLLLTRLFYRFIRVNNGGIRKMRSREVVLLAVKVAA